MKKKLLLLLTVLTLVVCMLVSCGECDEHVDANGDGKCDECDVAMPNPDPDPDPEPEHECVDENGDFICDDCGEEVVPPTPDRTGKTYAWEAATLKIQYNLHSSKKELDATSKRYMAGDPEASKGEKIDSAVSARNYDMYTTTKVSVVPTYIEDAAKYAGKTQGWNEYYKNAIADDLLAYVEGETADMYCGFAYDMTMSSALGYFHNLKATKIGDTDVKNYFTFLLDDYRPQFDTEGYLYEFMQDMSPIPESKMYLVASNFTLDVIRSIYVIPVSVKLLGALDVEALPEGSDTNKNGKYDIDEFYAMVRNGDWTYDMLATLSAAAFSPTSGASTPNLKDVLGFALDTCMGLNTSAFTYSIDFNWYDMKTENGTPVYTVSAESQDKLYEMSVALENLFTNKAGVIKLTNKTDAKVQMGANSNLEGIRERFSNDLILFGGVCVLGALDYDEYQNMTNGFGIAPIPLYAKTENSAYASSIHNLARVIGISSKISAERFSQCTAFLDYQSINSDEVADLYNRSLQYDTVNGEDYNVEILEYLIAHIRNNRDQYLENVMMRDGIIVDKAPAADYKFGNFFKQATGDVRKWFETAKSLKDKVLGDVVKKFNNLP